MGVKEWFWSVLSWGDAPEQDPDELVELTVVSLMASQLTVALLERHLIGATAVDQRRIPGEGPIDSSSIRVRAGDLEAARGVLAENG
jgi:hypothetical protein